MRAAAGWQPYRTGNSLEGIIMFERQHIYIEEKLRELQVDHLTLMDKGPGLIELAVTGAAKRVWSGLRWMGRRLSASAPHQPERAPASEVEQRPLTF
jgi:hypothetical protein